MFNVTAFLVTGWNNIEMVNFFWRVDFIIYAMLDFVKYKRKKTNANTFSDQ